MRYKKTIIAGVTILAAIVGVIIWQSAQKGKNSGLETIEAKRGDVVEIVSVTGNVEPASQIDLQFTASGKISEVNVRVGDNVLAGAILVSQDTSDLVFGAQSAGASVDSAKAKLAQLLAGSSAEDIALAQTAVANAQKTLDDANKALADAQASADNSINEVYQDAQRTLDSSLLTLQNSLQSNKDILESSELAGIFSVLDSGALTDAIILNVSAINDYNLAKSAVQASRLGLDEQKIELASEKLKTALNSAYLALGRTYDALAATVATLSLTQTELDAFKTTISTARTNLNTASVNIVTSQQNISSQKITNQTSLNTAQAKIAVAQGALNTSQDQLAQKQAGPRQADIDVLKAQVRQAEASLNQIRNQISQKNLTAPLDGVITKVSAEKGEVVSPGVIIVSMNSLSDFEIKTDVSESEIAKVKVGDKTSITFDAFGDNEIWQGNVAEIDPAQTVIQSVVYYRVTIGISGADSRIKSGMTANLDIETNRKDGAVVLPARAIFEKDGKKFVKILFGQDIIEKEIKTGLKGVDGEVEIVSGVEAGDKIIITISE